MGHAHVHTIELDLPLLIDTAFCAGAAMITFGAVLGKVSPTQLTWLLTLEVCSILAGLLMGSEGVQLPHSLCFGHHSWCSLHAGLACIDGKHSRQNVCGPLQDR